MEPFLKTLAERLAADFPGRVSHLLIVLPTKRAGLFLKGHLGKAVGQTQWAPIIITMEDLVAELSGRRVLEPLPLLFRFYQSYREQEGNAAQEFREFMQWAPQLLNDYNEVDNNLVDAAQLFRFVNETRAMEVWDPEGKGLTETQQHYLAFWESLGRYYLGLRDLLEEEKLAWSGMAARLASQALEARPQNRPFHYQDRPVDKVIFAGLYAMSKAEQRLLKILVHRDQAKVFWDADPYYTNNPAQEAGEVFSAYKQALSSIPFEWEHDLLSTTPKSIEVIGIAGNVGQAKTAGQVLRQLNPEGEFRDTAVVLINGGLLMPLLQNLPDAVETVNVTMGYPLKNSTLHSFWSALLYLHDHASRLHRRRKERAFHHKDISGVLNHPFVKHLPGGLELGREVLDRLRRRNRVLLTKAELLELVPKDSQETFARLDALFDDWEGDPKQALNAMQAVIGHFRDALMQDSENAAENGLELEFLFRYNLVVRQLQQLVERYGAIHDMGTLKVFFNRIVGGEQLSFYGEPLRGLQIMGMLETRALDFDNVILLGANEDQLPEGKGTGSFIPFDIRREFGLPTYRERDATYAYHFYRLLQRAKNVWLLYNTEPDVMGGGEKSRFVTQVLQELPVVNPQVQIRERIVRLPVIVEPSGSSRVEKSEAVMAGIRKLLEKGLSPSALNTYANCPLDFYYRYVAGIREAEEVEETIEASTLGDFVHKVLEDFYLPYLDQELTEEAVKNMLSHAERHTRDIFLTRFSEREIAYGKNLLTFQVAVGFVLKFLECELEFLRSSTLREPVRMVALEKDLYREIEVAGQRVSLHGLADRIDRHGNQLRIIDYKTGLVEPRELNLKTLDAIREDAHSAKARQLLMYAFLMAGEVPGPFQSGIISMRKLSEGLMPFRLNGNPAIDENVLADFEVQLRAMIGQLLDVNHPFEHQPGSPYCRFCGE